MYRLLQAVKNPIARGYTEFLKPALIYGLKLNPGSAYAKILERARNLDIPHEDLQEMKGIVDGYDATMQKIDPSYYRITIEDLLVGHVFLDTFKKLGTVGVVDAVFGCSTVALIKDGKAYLGRNLDWPDFFDAGIGNYTLVTKRPSLNGRKVVSVGFPGSAGVLTGMNDKGLSLAITESGASVSKEGMPYNLLMKKVLREASDCREAREVMEKTPCASSVNVALADKTATKLIQIEPEAPVAVREVRMQGVMQVAANHFVDPETLIPDQRSIADTTSLRRADAISAAVSDRLLKDDRARSALKDGLSAACALDTIQAVLMDPNRGEMEVAYGTGRVAERSNAHYQKIRKNDLFSW